MAVRITFDDFTERVFDSAVSVTKEIDRSDPYRLFDEGGEVVALLPDFGIRVVQIEN